MKPEPSEPPAPSGPPAPTHTTGIAGFDRLIAGPLPGDNVVFRVDDLDDFRLFCRRTVVSGFASGVASGERPLVYFRFARDAPLFTDLEISRYGIDRRELPLDQGFEHFITTAHAHIISLGATATLLFDSLSDLSGRYYSDRMVGNFFQLTCPLILETGSMAYFSLRRHRHSLHAIDPILETTQIFVDVYRHDADADADTDTDTDSDSDSDSDSDFNKTEPGGRPARYYIKPSKTDSRNPTADYSTFAWERDDRFSLVTESGLIAALVNRRSWPGLRSASHRTMGAWARVFLEAEVAATANAADSTQAAEAEPSGSVERHKDRLLQLVIAREGPILELARRYFDLPDLIAIWKHMIGTGFIGGKSVGMLLSRAILRRDDPVRATRLETHDSFYVASDVYYTYLVINNCWWERQRQKDSATFLEGNDRVRARMLAGRFPDTIMDRFSDMIDYFGTSPIIVRSSSLLEDNFGNAFAGKYESVFCTMRGTREERLREFLVAVRRIYASTISDEALSYRQHRGILDQDEQMALLVQRVSGAAYHIKTESGTQTLFFPHLAGVAFSFNPYAWHPSIDPHAGLVRLVFGLGTRAVDRSDDDYTRVVALNAPDRRPEAGAEEVRRHTQRRIDVLALEPGRAEDAVTAERSVYFDDIIEAVPVDSRGTLPIAGVATRERDRSRRSGRSDRSRPPERPTWNLTFDPLLRESTLASDMQQALTVLRAAYGTDVDIEFTVNLDAGSWDYRINLVQCRPLQIQGAHFPATPVPELAPEDILIRCTGGVIGHSRVVPIGRILYVRPDAYAALPETARHELTGVIRAVATAQSVEGALMLVGPGRWGTSTPSLGIPIRMSDIGSAVILCEIDRIHEGLVADMSLGTHFFNEMVERNLLYMALRIDRSDTVLDTTSLDRLKNHLPAYSDSSLARWTGVVTVIHFSPSEGIFLNADSRQQIALVYRDRKGSGIPQF